MDQSVAIQETLTTEENCVIAVECVSLLDGVKNSRLLGLVHHNNEHAIFLYCHRRMAITGDDVTLDDIIPISYDFSVVEVSSPDELAVLGADTRVRVTYLAEELELRLPFGSQARLFLSEVNRAWSDACEQYPEVKPKFDWLAKYRKVSRGARSLRKSLTSHSSRSSVMSQSKRSEKSHRDDKPEQKSRGDVLQESQDRARGDVRDELIRSTQPVLSNKDQMLGMPQFGLRDNLIKCELLKNEDAYTYIQNYSFFLGTYNVNGQNPKESLVPWLGSASNPPDFYLVGFQELDLSKEAFLFNDTPKEPEWMLAVYQGLHPDAKYALVKLERLVGIMLLMYVKAEHAAHISEVEAESVGTGVMGRMGNKGAVALRFRFHNSDICVVNSHLAAHTEDFERRNQDFKDICRRMQFGQQDPALPPLTIMKHNVVLWLGDLNYRISDLDVEHVKDLIAKKDFESLYNHDQLKRQMDEENVFVGFTEGEIDFQPTYKYDTGSDQWDTSEKCRVPAWCDRILWRGKNVKQHCYESHMSLKSSDHKPVSCLLEIGIKMVNEESYKRKFEEIVRHIDRLENDCIPSVSVSESEFHFKDVKFMQNQVRTVTVCNEGQVPCQFEFIQKLDEPAYCKPWLTAIPAKGFLAQGASVDIDLEVFVNHTTAPGLNSGQQQLEDILILHLERGKDYFISITGSYLPSCFGSSLSTLCHLRAPIQDMNLDTIRDLTVKSKSQPSDSEPQDIPKEIWMMVDHLLRYAKKQEDLFQQPGLRTEFQEIRDCLDTGSSDTLPGSNHSVAEALLLFLDALPEPVVPFSFYQRCLESCSDSSQCRQIISVLPQCHKNAFNYLTAFIQELLKHSAHNRLDINILASVFAGLLLRSPTKQDLVEKRKAKEFFQHFLVLSSSDGGLHDELCE